LCPIPGNVEREINGVDKRRTVPVFATVGAIGLIQEYFVTSPRASVLCWGFEAES